MFSVILVECWFVFSIIFNNQTCIWNKTTNFIPCIWNKTLKLRWIHAHKLHATWKINVILLYEAVNKSDTGSGCKPHCNEVSGDQRRRDEPACVRMAAVFMTLLNRLCSYNESDLRQRTSYFDVSLWFHSLQKMLRFHTLLIWTVNNVWSVERGCERVMWHTALYWSASDWQSSRSTC